MRALSVGCILNRTASAGAGARRDMFRRAETVGLDHFGFGDHVTFFGGAGADGLLAAAGALSVTEKLGANTAVYLLPLRHPVTVARQVADLASLAPGRFVFGVGIGGEDPHEVESCGVDPRTRGRRMDESLRIVRELLAGGAVDFEGEHFRLRDVRISPAATVPVPIVVGGRSDAAIRRAGRSGDGWFGIWVSPERYHRAIDAMGEAASAADRPVPAGHNALNVWCGVGATTALAREHVAAAMQEFYGIPYERFERWSPAGTPSEIAAFLAPYVEAGCTLFNLILNGTDGEHELDAAAEIREHLLQSATSS